jgi:hypothetical protein
MFVLRYLAEGEVKMDVDHSLLIRIFRGLGGDDRATRVEYGIGGGHLNVTEIGIGLRRGGYWILLIASLVVVGSGFLAARTARKRKIPVVDILTGEYAQIRRGIARLRSGSFSHFLFLVGLLIVACLSLSAVALGFNEYFREARRPCADIGVIRVVA